MPNKLRQAIALWKRDMPLTVTHAFALAEMGFDVEALEAQYRA